MRVVPAYYVTATLVIVAALVTWLRERDFKRSFNTQEKFFTATVSTLEEALERRNREYTTLLDRLYASKNFPPSEVSMAQVYTERKQAETEKRIERRNGGPVIRPGIGPVDTAQAQMAEDVRRKSATTPSASQTLTREIDESKSNTASASIE